MEIKKAMAEASQHKGATGIFYNPASMDAVIAEHSKEPEGYIIWCDCSVAVRTIEGCYGSIEDACGKIAK